MPEFLKVCVVGCGARGSQYAEAWNNRDDAEVVALSDVDPERLKTVAGKYDAAAYEDWREAVLHPGVDVVSVCVPTAFHADVTCLAAENGRHVLCEKPLALTLQDGERMLRSVEANKVVFMPCFQYRDQDIHRLFREFFQAGKFGGPAIFRFAHISEVRPKTSMHSKSRNGGVVIDMACHIFDLMRWITGREAVRVYAGGHIFGKGKQRLAEIKDFAIDEASIEVTMEGGHQLQAYFNWGMPENFPKIGGDRYMLGPELCLRGIAGPPPALEAMFADHRELWPLEPGCGLETRFDKFVEAIQYGIKPDINGRDALEALKISLAALESIETGQAVRLTPEG